MSASCCWGFKRRNLNRCSQDLVCRALRGRGGTPRYLPPNCLAIFAVGIDRICHGSSQPACTAQGARTGGHELNDITFQLIAQLPHGQLVVLHSSPHFLKCVMREHAAALGYRLRNGRSCTRTVKGQVFCNGRHTQSALPTRCTTFCLVIIFRCKSGALSLFRVLGRLHICARAVVVISSR
jgi:hypothetical protein